MVTVEERPHISASQITTWMQCRLKHHFSRTAERPTGIVRMDVGTLVHAALERYLRAPVSARTSDLFQASYEAACVPFDIKETQDKAHEVLMRYWKKWRYDELWIPNQFEVRLNHEIIPGLDLLGYADELIIDHKRKSIILGEKKTSLSKPDLLTTPFLNVQGQVYRFLLEQEYPGYRLDKIIYTMLWRQGAQRIERPLTDTGPFWDAWLRSIAYEIMALPVRMEPGHWCRGCDFKEVCLESIMTGQDAQELDQHSSGWISEEEDEG